MIVDPSLALRSDLPGSTRPSARARETGAAPPTRPARGFPGPRATPDHERPGGEDQVVLTSGSQDQLLSPDRKYRSGSSMRMRRFSTAETGGSRTCLANRKERSTVTASGRSPEVLPQGVTSCGRIVPDPSAAPDAYRSRPQPSSRTARTSSGPTRDPAGRSQISLPPRLEPEPLAHHRVDGLDLVGQGVPRHPPRLHQEQPARGTPRIGRRRRMSPSPGPERLDLGERGKRPLPRSRDNEPGAGRTDAQEWPRGPAPAQRSRRHAGLPFTVIYGATLGRVTRSPPGGAGTRPNA